MIHAQTALLRHAQDFFLRDLVGLYVWDQVLVSEPEKPLPIPPNMPRADRLKEMQAREGRGKYLEQTRLIFPLPVRSAIWEILIYSSMEKPPLGEVMLRDAQGGEIFVSGALDPATWSEIGIWIRSHQQRIAS